MLSAFLFLGISTYSCRGTTLPCVGSGVDLMNMVFPGDTDLMDQSLFSVAREEARSYMRQRSGHQASIWLVTQADLLYVMIEQKYTSVSMNQRWLAIRSLSTSLVTIFTEREPFVYEVARVLTRTLGEMGANGPSWDVLMALVHGRLLRLGLNFLRDSPGIIVPDQNQMSWDRLLQGILMLDNTDGVTSYFLREIDRMVLQERELFSSLVYHTGLEYQSLTERAGQPVADIFPFARVHRMVYYEDLNPLYENARNQRMQKYSEILELLKHEGMKVLNRIEMFDRWNKAETADLRSTYSMELVRALAGLSTSAFLRNWEAVDAFISAVSLGESPQMDEESLRSILLVRPGPREPNPLRTELEGLSPPAQTPLAIRYSGDAISIQYQSVLADLRILMMNDNPELMVLIDHALGNIVGELEPHSMQSLVGFLTEQINTKYGLTGILGLAYHLGRKCGVRLLANEELAAQVLGKSVDRIKVYRQVVSSWLHMHEIVDDFTMYQIEQYLEVATEAEATALVTAMKLLTIASKDYEVKPYAIHAFPGSQFLQGLEFEDIPQVVAVINTIIPPSILERYRSLPIADELRDLAQQISSHVKIFDPMTEEINRVYRPLFAKAMSNILVEVDCYDLFSSIVNLPLFVYDAFFVRGLMKSPNANAVARIVTDIVSKTVVLLELLSGGHLSSDGQRIFRDEFTSFVNLLCHGPFDDSFLGALENAQAGIASVTITEQTRVTVG